MDLKGGFTCCGAALSFRNFARLARVAPKVTYPPAMNEMAPDNTLQDAAVRLRALSRALKDSGVAMLHYGLDSARDLSENLPEGWPTDDPDTILEALARVAETGEAQTVEVDAGPRRFRVRITPDLDDADESSYGTFAVVTDITEARQRDAALRGLLREVSHRSKNLLAIVQAIALQTANNSETTDEFIIKLRGRLASLSGTQDLVTASDWHGVRFRDIATMQLAAGGQIAIDVEGDDPMLRPNAALYVGLALHELVTNARMHSRGGTVNVRADIAGKPTNPVLTVSWFESTSGETEPRNPRFGTTVLEKVVPISVAGSAHYDLGAGQVRYVLSMPASQFEL